MAEELAAANVSHFLAVQVPGSKQRHARRQRRRFRKQLQRPTKKVGLRMGVTSWNFEVVSDLSALRKEIEKTVYGAIAIPGAHSGSWLQAANLGSFEREHGIVAGHSVTDGLRGVGIDVARLQGRRFQIFGSTWVSERDVHRRPQVRKVLLFSKSEFTALVMFLDHLFAGLKPWSCSKIDSLWRNAVIDSFGPEIYATHRQSTPAGLLIATYGIGASSPLLTTSLARSCGSGRKTAKEYRRIRGVVERLKLVLAERDPEGLVEVDTGGDELDEAAMEKNRRLPPDRKFFFSMNGQRYIWVPETWLP